MDEVSLRSLLASQTGALTEQITELLSRADEAEIAGTVSAASPLLKAEVKSRYQTSNSQGSQTSRKSIVQSLFKEFRELDGVDLILQPLDVIEPAASLDELLDPASAMAVRADDLKRGDLVEVEVELAADPIFRFSTVISEISDMAKEYPDMLAAGGAAGIMAEADPVNRVLQRLLAGLIPLRARATSVVMVRHEGVEYLAPVASVTALGIDATPVCMVGVTEHLSYWRDVRRVLFSGARFTMLCRVARDGLHREWVPVKLSEVLAEVSPGFPSILDAVAKVGGHETIDVGATTQESALQIALTSFVDLACSKTGGGLPEVVADQVWESVAACEGMAGSVTSQNEAFRFVLAVLRDAANISLPPEEWLDLQRQARSLAGLTLFRGSGLLSDVSRTQVAAVSDGNEGGEVLLDTEVIAIYW